MKILKYLLILLVILFAAFWAIGTFTGPVTYTSEITVDAPVTSTWVSLQNPMKLGEWLEGYESMEMVSGFPGMVGSKLKLIFTENGEKMEVLETITARKEMKQFAFDIESEWLNASTDIRLSSIGVTACKLSSTTTMQGDGWIKHGMLFLMKSMIANKDQENYDRLKAMIEG